MLERCCNSNNHITDKLKLSEELVSKNAKTQNLNKTSQPTIQHNEWWWWWSHKSVRLLIQADLYVAISSCTCSTFCIPPSTTLCCVVVLKVYGNTVNLGSSQWVLLNLYLSLILHSGRTLLEKVVLFLFLQHYAGL